MKAETEPAYRYLEARAHPWRKIFWIKGRSMHVWHLLATLLREGESLQGTAKNAALPMDAVREALDYNQRNEALVDAETEEEGTMLFAAGANSYELNHDRSPSRNL